MKASTLDLARKVLLALAAACIVLGIATQGCSSNETSSFSITEGFGDIEWPKSELADMIPEPESKYGKIVRESSNDLIVNIGKTSSEAYREYVKKCQEKGFDIDYSKSDTDFTAQNEAGYALHVFHNRYDDYMSINLSSPTDTDEPVPSSSSAAASSDDLNSSSDSNATPEAETTIAAETSDGSAGTPADGIRPSFKEAVDSYEAFIEEYCSFMKKYYESGSPISMAADYARFMAQYADTMSKLDGLEQENLSSEEMQYYLNAMSRINQKLAETTTSMQ